MEAKTGQSRPGVACLMHLCVCVMPGSRKRREHLSLNSCVVAFVSMFGAMLFSASGVAWSGFLRLQVTRSAVLFSANSG